MTEEHKSHEEIIAKHKLEQSEVVEVLNFFKKYGKMIGYGISALVIIFAISTVAKNKRHQANAEAGQLLMTASSEDAFQQIIDKYAQTSAAPSALLALARSAYNKGEYEIAQAAYNDFLKKYSSHDMAAIAAYGQAACLEAQNNLEAAATEYQKTADEYPESFIVPMALLNQGNVLVQLGKNDEAISAFENTLIADPSGTWRAQAQNKLASLRK
jgi:predicted negative regulator of RcsB-dependent stress response